MSIELMQSENTYDVELEGVNYTLTKTYDANSDYENIVIYDEGGKDVEGELYDKIVKYFKGGK